MLEKVKDMPMELWGVLNEMSPYLLFGFLVAGILSVVVKQETVENHLGGRGLWQITKAAAFGVPLPLCSCGVIPVAVSLRKHGASKGATIAFLISTPHTGLDNILVTYSLLGIIIAIFTPIAALASGIIGGISVSLFEKNGSSEIKDAERCKDACCTDHSLHNAVYKVFHYGFVVLPQDIAKSLVVGLLIAGFISVFLPEHFFHDVISQGFAQMLIMMVIGIPMYVCATASIPIAAALIAKGVSPGAAIVFLMTGPVTNAASITTIWKIMGGRAAFIYLLSIAVCALASGLILDSFLSGMRIEEIIMSHEMLPSYLRIAASVILLVMLAAAFYRPKTVMKHEKIPTADKGEIEIKQTVLAVEGMTCSHCAKAVQKAILESGGVDFADVDLKAHTATIGGRGYNLAAISKAIEQLGYKVESSK